MIVLLLLCALISLGVSEHEMKYGSKFMIRLFGRAQTLEYKTDYGSRWKTIWDRDNPPALEDSGHTVVDPYYVIESVTQKDNGIYRQKDKSGNYLTTQTLVVRPHTRHETRTPGGTINLYFDMKPESCNIFFIPEEGYEHMIDRQGELASHWNEYCTGFEPQYPCGIINDNLELSCNGRIEIRDELNNEAFVMTLETEYLTQDHDISSVGVAMGIMFIVFGCCFCVKQCCCKNSPQKKNESESPVSEPATNYLTYDREPAAPRREQPSEVSHPALPSYNPSRPLIHNPPVSEPPAYSEVTATTRVEEEAPTLPVPAEDPGPRFELSFVSEMPLGSDSNLSHVYTSDKLNF